MNEKQLKLFAGVFAFLIVIFLISKPRSKSVDVDQFVQNIIIGVVQEDVRGVEIYKEQAQGEPVRMKFAKVEDQWRILTHHNAKAQKSNIEEFIDDALGMTGKLRTDDVKHHESFQITDDTGLHVLLKDETDKTLANLIIGKKPEDSGNSFVRFTGNDKIYFTDKNLLSSLSITGAIDTLSMFKQDGFVDLQAVEEKKDDLSIVALVKDRKEMILKKIQRDVEVMQADSTMKMEKKDVWVLTRGKKELDLEQTELDKFFADILKIRGSEVVDRIGNSLNDLSKSGQYGVSRPKRYIVFRTPDGKQKNVIFGKEYEKDKGYYMQVQYDEGLVYKLSTSTYDNIWKWMKDLPEKTI
ncbi:DUF4340 domain-containing protein [bacterium]|nr:DUF4340 domain-containing protein [bacterium]